MDDFHLKVKHFCIVRFYILFKLSDLADCMWYHLPVEVEDVNLLWPDHGVIPGCPLAFRWPVGEMGLLGCCSGRRALVLHMVSADTLTGMALVTVEQKWLSTRPPLMPPSGEGKVCFVPAVQAHHVVFTTTAHWGGRHLLPIRLPLTELTASWEWKFSLALHFEDVCVSEAGLVV